MVRKKAEPQRGSAIHDVKESAKPDGESDEAPSQVTLDIGVASNEELSRPAKRAK